MYARWGYQPKKQLANTASDICKTNAYMHSIDIGVLLLGIWNILLYHHLCSTACQLCLSIGIMKTCKWGLGFWV